MIRRLWALLGARRRTFVAPLVTVDVSGVEAKLAEISAQLERIAHAVVTPPTTTNVYAPDTWPAAVRFDTRPTRRGGQ